MSNTNNQPSTTSQRREATADALASVRAEGLQPSHAAEERLNRYAEGKISASQLQREILSEVRATTGTKKAS